MTKLLLLIFVSLSCFAEPKYGSKVTLLRADNQYLKSTSAPDFWTLIPFYEGMRTGHSAGAASLRMVINGLRKDVPYTRADELLTEEDLIKKFGIKKGITLDELAKVLEKALRSYQIKKTVTVVKDLKDLRKILEENEVTDGNFLIANYQQSSFTDDPEGAVGTYSVVGAFNAPQEKVLILETDRKYYEPYWVSLEIFRSGLNDLKGKGGLLWIY